MPVRQRMPGREADGVSEGRVQQYRLSEFPDARDRRLCAVDRTDAEPEDGYMPGTVRLSGLYLLSHGHREGRKKAHEVEAEDAAESVSAYRKAARRRENRAGEGGGIVSELARTRDAGRLPEARSRDG